MILSGNLNEAVAQEEDEEEKACNGHRDADDFEKTRRETPAGGDADQQETKDLGRTKLTGDGNITCPCVGLEGRGERKRKITRKNNEASSIGRKVVVLQGLSRDRQPKEMTLLIFWGT